MSGRWPDVRAFPRCRMSGRWGRMSGLARSSFWTFCDGAPDVRAVARCPGFRDGPDVRAGRPDVGADEVQLRDVL